MKLKFFYCLFTLFIIISGSCVVVSLKAQAPKKPLRIITTKDGLPQSFISGLTQDVNGFVWIGTRNGLARYDGIHFKVFRHSKSDTASISSNVIISLKQNSRKLIYIEHESSQIDVLNPTKETIHRITAAPLFKNKTVRFVRRGWLVDRDDKLWVAEKANGIFVYNWKLKTISHLTQKSHGLPSDTIRGFLEDHKKQIWVVSQRGLSLFNTKTEKFSHVALPFEADYNNYVNSDAEIVAVHERKNGEIMFSDRRQLILYNPSTGSFRMYAFPFLSVTGINSIQTGPDGYEYMESGGFVYRYDEKKGLVAVGDVAMNSMREVPSFLIDQSGLIWLGTNAAGIHQIDLTTPFFESSASQFSFHRNLIKQELNTTLEDFSGWPLSDKQFSSSSYFFRSAYDKNNQLWIALRDQVGRYDSLTKRFTLLPKAPVGASPANLSFGIRGIAFSPENKLWVIGYDGYIGQFDVAAKTWVPFLDPVAIRKGTDKDLTLLDLSVDRDKLWITTGTGQGLLSVEIRTKKITWFNQKTHPDLFPTDLLQGLQQDPANPDLLWIGTYDGLVRLSKKTLNSEVFTMEDGLPDNTIYSILTDKSGYLWLSTNKGLLRFHPVSHQLQTFHSADGLPGDEFNRFHHLKLPDGRLAFGGTEGWILFDPTAMLADTFRPQVAFTALKINNELVTPSSDGLLPAPLNELNELSLPYDQNSLTVEFAGLEFSRPKKLRYRYQLEGYDEKWIISDNTPIANYTKLPPGDYKLRINSSNTTGQWSPHVRDLVLHIKPPFWQTWWAYIFYSLAAAGLIWLYINYRLNRERLRQDMILKEREAEQLKTLDEMKTRFFSNITHEFRTPLTLVLTPAQRLKTTLQQPDQLRWLDAIERNAHQLLRLINQLLDLSKLESGSLKINEARGDIGKFLENLVESFSEDGENKGVKLSFNNPLEDTEYWFDPDKLERIVSNLLANALKFTSRGGSVQLILSEEIPDSGFEKNQKNGIFLTILDSGIGIPKESLPYVFDRFYQVDNPAMDRRQSHGSGIGLSLVKELVDLQKGHIEVSSTEEKDSVWKTKFTVWLPYRKADISDGISNQPFISLKTENQSYGLINDVLDSGQGKSVSSEAVSVLLVEDNAELAEFIADSLPETYFTTKAINGADGIEKALSFMPDLIISDVLMPVMDGFEFCSRLKKDDRTNHIPIVLLTAKVSFDDRIEGLTLGADDYLTKPFHIQELQLRVNNLLERQNRQREKIHSEINSTSSVSFKSSEMQPAVHDIFIQKIYVILDQKLDDSTFGVEQLAAEIGMSRANLHRKTKTMTGMSPGDIIRNYRLKRAAQFLLEGHNSSETAYLVGFESPAYFSKCFRDFYKTTPHEYAQSMH
ncbi:hybrid sensor histidine kinase/response regulator transcription factor [Dyadobacter psychrotolerans]|uniref:histidine kinase n=1 Tax=Dyadobacter psychrotolerans TaxID=2541721 RepID=A0A4R5DHD9_9BACT|nr:hybrid sensor histidine kinase/response regulator transcription factor [Dyadobacter psychrotolerans]TDE11274.1 hybrid sensor histidine kinase/response regulator [Dyadobacter psychrotolerans]